MQMSTTEPFYDISNPGVCITSGDYEIHTLSNPSDLSSGIVIHCYQHDVQNRYRALWVKHRTESTTQYSCEFLRNFTLHVCCRVSPFAANLFHLFDVSGKWLVPLGELINSDSAGERRSFLLRMIWKPSDLVKLHKTDPAALRYLYFQCHDDFVYGDTVERVSSTQKTYELLLGLVIFDMVAFALNSEPKISLKDLKRNYKAKQFMNKKILTDIEPTQRFQSVYQCFNTMRLDYICKKNLDKHYHEFCSPCSDGLMYGSDEGALNVMLSYIKEIVEKDPNCTVITGQLADEGESVIIDQRRNRVYQCRGDDKEELFEISKLQKHNGIKVCESARNRTDDPVKVWKIQLYITEPQNFWREVELRFASRDEAYHIAAALVSLYQSAVHYVCVDLTQDELLAPPTIVRLKNSGFHGPLSDSEVKLLNKLDRPGAYILRQSPQDWRLLYLDVWNHLPNLNHNNQCAPSLSPRLNWIKYLVLHSDGVFKVMGCFNMNNNYHETAIPLCEEPFSCLAGEDSLIANYKLAGKTIALKEIISPSSDHRAGFKIKAMIEDDQPICTSKNPDCSQAHIISSRQLDILKNIGNGAFTSVSVARWKAKTVAVKRVQESQDQLTLERELQISASRFIGLKNNFLVEIHGICLDTMTQCLVVEYCSHGSLSNFLLQDNVQKALKRKHLVHVQRQILTGLEFLHRHSSYHGNVRCRNVLVCDYRGSSIPVKLADPGLIQTDECRPRLPEARLDLLSYGKTALEMYSIWTPSEMNKHETQQFRPKHCPEELYELVLIKCLNHTSYPNLTAADVLKDLTSFEQDFHGGDLKFFTSEAHVTEGGADENNSLLIVYNREHDVPFAMEGNGFESMVIDRTLIHYNEKSQNILGQGHYGQVFRGMYQNHCCAIKRLHQKHSDSIELDNELEREFEIMSQLKHQSIVKLYGRCHPIRDADQSEPYLLVMEFMEGGCLLVALQKRGQNITGELLMEWALQIAEGLKYLHSQHVVHRDLACRNILLTKDLRYIKISDFGLARLLDENSYYKCGQRDLPMYWLAPESFPVYQNAKFVTPSDVWSYGVVLWELFSYGEKPQSREPFKQKNTYQQLYHLFMNTKERLPQTDKCPDHMFTLMNQCWEFDFKKRPTADDITKQLLMWRTETSSRDQVC